MGHGDSAGGEPRQPRRARQPGKISVDIHALLVNRDYIKTTTYLLPRGAKIRVLNMMEHFRLERRGQRPASTASRASPLPEMTGPELVREINWRIGTLPPRDAEAIAQYVRRLTRWRTMRHRRRGGDGAPPGRPPQDRVP